MPLNIDASSQFLSALLLNGVFSKTGFDVVLTGKRDAKAYVKISMKMMEEFGVSMRQKSENEYEILPSGHYTAREYQIEPDVSAACYFMRWRQSMEEWQRQHMFILIVRREM